MGDLHAFPLFYMKQGYYHTNLSPKILELGFCGALFYVKTEEDGDVSYLFWLCNGVPNCNLKAVC